MASNPIVHKVAGSVQSSSTTTVNVISFTPPSENDITFHCVASVAGFHASTPNGGGYLVAATYKKTAGGGLVQVGSTADCHTPQEDDAAWTVTMDASGGAIRVRVTGDVDQTIEWGASMEILTTQN